MLMIITAPDYYCQVAFFLSSVKRIGDLKLLYRRAAFKVLLLTFRFNDVFCTFFNTISVHVMQ